MENLHGFKIQFIRPTDKNLTGKVKITDLHFDVSISENYDSRIGSVLKQATQMLKDRYIKIDYNISRFAGDTYIVASKNFDKMTKKSQVEMPVKKKRRK